MPLVTAEPRDEAAFRLTSRIIRDRQIPVALKAHCTIPLLDTEIHPTQVEQKDIALLEFNEWNFWMVRKLYERCVPVGNEK
jgi:hypothetical protein